MVMSARVQRPSCLPKLSRLMEDDLTCSSASRSCMSTAVPALDRFSLTPTSTAQKQPGNHELTPRVSRL